MSWIVSPQKGCWSPKVLYLWLWPYLEKGFLQMKSKKDLFL